MFVNFFHELKRNSVPVSLREYLSLLEALDAEMMDEELLDAPQVKDNGGRIDLPSVSGKKPVVKDSIPYSMPARSATFVLAESGKSTRMATEVN